VPLVFLARSARPIANPRGLGSHFRVVDQLFHVAHSIGPLTEALPGNRPARSSRDPFEQAINPSLTATAATRIGGTSLAALLLALLTWLLALLTWLLALLTWLLALLTWLSALAWLLVPLTWLISLALFTLLARSLAFPRLTLLARSLTLLSLAFCGIAFLSLALSCLAILALDLLALLSPLALTTALLTRLLVLGLPLLSARLAICGGIGGVLAVLSRALAFGAWPIRIGLAVAPGLCRRLLARRLGDLAVHLIC
jgi:hypothetical protein